MLKTIFFTKSNDRTFREGEHVNLEIHFQYLLETDFSPKLLYLASWKKSERLELILAQNCCIWLHGRS